MSKSFGRYNLLGVLGQGGMGKVYRAYDPYLKKEVALKTILVNDNPIMLKRFAREVRAMRQLSHENIVQIYDVGVIDNINYFTMELIVGKTLNRWIDEKITVTRTLKIMLQVVDAVAHAHQQNIIHRDLKPSNIIVDSSGKSYVTDFGIAKEIHGNTDLSQTGLPVGTIPYMPPEQALGEKKKIDERSDIYSLGVILYQMLTGSLPFTGKNIPDVIAKVINEAIIPPSKVSNRISSSLDNICLKATAKDPSRRYQSCDELRQDLQNLIDGQPILASRLSISHYILVWIRRNYRRCLVFFAFSVMMMLIIWQNYALHNEELQRKKVEEEKNRKLKILEAELKRSKLSTETRGEDEEKRSYILDKKMQKLLSEAEKSIINGNRQAAVLYYGFILSKSTNPFYTQIAHKQLQYHIPRLPVLLFWPAVSQKVFSFALNKKRTRLYMGHEQKIEIWDIKAKKILNKIKTPVKVEVINVSPNEKKIAYGQIRDKYSLHVYHKKDKKNYKQDTKKGQIFRGMAFNSKGSLFVYADQSSLTIKSSKLGFIENNYQGFVNSIAFHPSKNLFVVGEGMNKNLLVVEPKKIWILTANKIVRKYDDHKGKIIVNFSNNGKMLASGSPEGLVHIRSIKEAPLSFRIQSTFFAVPQMNSLQFSPNSRLLACSNESQLKIFDCNNWRYLVYFFPLIKIDKIEFIDEQKLILCNGHKIFQIQLPKKFYPEILHDSHLGRVSKIIHLSPQSFISFGVNHYIYTWDHKQKKIVKSGRSLFNKGIISADISPKGELIAIGHNPGIVGILSKDMNYISKIESFGNIKEVAFLQETKAIAYITRNTLIFADWHNKVLLRKEKLISLNTIAHFFDNHLGDVIACGGRGKIFVFLQQDKAYKKELLHLGGITSLDFSPDGKYLVSGGEDLILWNWRKGTKKILAIETPHSQAVCFSPNGSFIASAHDKDIILWDTASGYMIDILKGHRYEICSLSFSPDGKYLVTGDNGSLVIRWNMEIIDLPKEKKKINDLVKKIARARFKRFQQKLSEWENEE